MRDAVLHLGRMLCRAVDQHAAILARDGERDLSLEIEMILSPGAQPSAQAMWRGGEGGAGTATLHDLWCGDVALGGERRLDREDGWQRRVVDGNALCRLTRSREPLGGHECH